MDAFCWAMDERPFGQDDLGRALFEGHPEAGVPGFAGLRDDLLKDLVVAVNLLRGMAAGLVVTGGRYATTEAANTGIPYVGPCPKWLKDPEEYKPELGPSGLPTTTPPPDFVSQAIWFLESVGFGSAWPDADLDGVTRLRDAATALGRVVGDVQKQIAEQAGRATEAGLGPATAAFGRAARVVHGEKGQLADLRRRCEHLAYCGQIAYDAIVKARWRFVASAVFVLTLMLLSKLLAPRLGPLLDVAVKKLFRAEGLALRIILLVIRQAALGAMFSGGLGAINQLFTTGDIDAAKLVRDIFHGALAGGLMAGAHAALPALLRRGGPALTGLAEAMESATWERAFSRILAGGAVSTTVLATAGWASGAGWNWKHAAEMGFGMAVLSTGAALASRTWPAPSYASLRGRDWKQSPAKRWHDVKWALGVLAITAPAVSVFALAKNDRPLLNATRQETIEALGPTLGPRWNEADLAGKPGLFGPFPNKIVELGLKPKTDAFDIQRGHTGIWHDKTASLHSDRNILWEFISTYLKRIS